MRKFTDDNTVENTVGSGKNALIAVAAFVLTVFCLVPVLLFVHPTEQTRETAPEPVAGEAVKQTADISVKMEQYANNLASTALDGLTYIRKIYTIDDAALSGPVPDSTCYGSSMDPADVSAVVEQASELLDGQTLSWNPDLELRPDTPIQWYYDETILVICWQEVHHNCVYNYAEVKIAHPSQFRRMLAGNTFGASQQLTCTTMASAANAVLASNADFYAFRGTGIQVWNGSLYMCDDSLLDTCFIDSNGDLLCVHSKTMDEQAALDFIKEHDVQFSLSFGPILVENGVPITSISYPIGEVNEIYARSAIGQLGELHYMLMTAGMAGIYSNSAKIVESAAAMAEKGCSIAYALDGGQTAEIVFGGKIFNRVVYDSERATSDIIYFATAIPNKEGS